MIVVLIFLHIPAEYRRSVSNSLLQTEYTINESEAEANCVCGDFDQENSQTAQAAPASGTSSCAACAACAGVMASESRSNPQNVETTGSAFAYSRSKSLDFAGGPPQLSLAGRVQLTGAVSMRHLLPAGLPATRTHNTPRPHPEGQVSGHHRMVGRRGGNSGGVTWVSHGSSHDFRSNGYSSIANALSQLHMGPGLRRTQMRSDGGYCDGGQESSHGSCVPGGLLAANQVLNLSSSGLGPASRGSIGFAGGTPAVKSHHLVRLPSRLSKSSLALEDPGPLSAPSYFVGKQSRTPSCSAWHDVM